MSKKTVSKLPAVHRKSKAQQSLKAVVKPSNAALRGLTGVMAAAQPLMAAPVALQVVEE